MHYSVLYVDDELPLLEIAKVFLESIAELRVIPALSADEGLDILRTEPVDAIVSDYQMIDRDGIAFLKEVRSCHGDIPFILFTGKGREEVVIEAIGSGVDFYLQKGGEPAAMYTELAHKIRIAVERKRAMDSLKSGIGQIGQGWQGTSSGDLNREDVPGNVEDLYRLLVENASDVIWTMDLTGRFTYVSPSVEKLRGYTADEVLQQSIDQVLTPESASIAVRKLAVAVDEVSSGRRFPSFRAELEQVCRDGSTVWTDVTVTGVYNGDEIVGILGITRDITDRKRLEQAVQESESKLMSIFNGTSDAIQIIGIREDGLPGNYIEINDVGCRMLQYSREELYAKSPLDISTDFSQLERARNDLKTTGSATFETGYRRKDGYVIPVEISARVATIGGRAVSVSVVRDITERKRSEDAIRLANHKLNLLSSVTRHDVLNLLMALKGYVDLSKERSADETCRSLHEKQEELISRIERQIMFTREYQDIGDHAPSWQNVKKTIAAAVQGLDTSRTFLDEEVEESLEILADRLLQKVFFNLVENALRHGGAGLKRIRISSGISGNNLVITCEDDGAGIPPGEKETIFLHGYGRNSGFGLFLIREILAITGITIEESGGEGHGARFLITVPEGTYRFR